MYEIKIISNDEEMALDMQEPSFPYTFENASVTELKDQSASWSYTIKMPRSQRNEQVFENAGAPFVDTNTPYKRLECNVYSDGIEIIHRGVLFIDTAYEDHYDVQILSGTADVFELLNDIDLKEDKLGLNTQITLPTLSLRNPSRWVVYPNVMQIGPGIYNESKKQEYYYYAMPIVHIGSPGYEWDGIFPALLKRIGYTLESDNVDECLSNTWITLADRKRLTSGGQPTTYRRQLIRDNVWHEVRIPTPQELFSRTLIDVPREFKIYEHIHAEVSDEYRDSRGNPIAPAFIVEHWDSRNNSRGYRNTRNQNGQRADNREPLTPYEPGYPLNQYWIDGKLDFLAEMSQTRRNEFLKAENDAVAFAWSTLSPLPWSYTDPYTGQYIRVSDTNIVNMYAEIIIVPPDDGDFAYPGDTIDVFDNLGITNGLEFFKLCAQLCGWIVNVKDRTIQAHTFKYILEREEYAPDWTDKVAQDVDWKVQFEFGDYAQNNRIKFQENSETGFTDAVNMPIQSARLKKETDLLEIDATSGAGNMVEYWKWEDDGSITFSSSGSHIVRLVSIIVDPLNPQEIVEHFSALDVRDNYQSLFSTLQKMHVMTIKMALTALDIHHFDPFTPIYLRQTGSYYFVNKIDKWEDGKLAEVELIKL